MILRRLAINAETASPEKETPASAAAGPRGSWSQRATLKMRLAVFTAAMVALAVGTISIIAYWTVSSALTASVDRELEAKAGILMQQATDPLRLPYLKSDLEQFKQFNPDTRVSISPPGWTFSTGDTIPIGGDFKVMGDASIQSIRTVAGERILARYDSLGTTVVVAQNMDPTHQLITSLGVVLLVISLIGVLVAITAGVVISTAGLTPLWRLQRAVDYVTRTDDLRPIAVVGNDDLAHLTRSFNAMLATLQESRVRQAQLVADAGHELKTPLTSMRTNIEFLMMLNRPGEPNRLSEQDRQDLERDVIAQMEELSTLIGDLVDLAREDAPGAVTEEVDMEEIIDSSLERVKRRRPDVTFELHTMPWTLSGDPFALGRSVVNLMDNAAKWSPPDGTVVITMHQVGENVEISFVDSGPGIKAENHDRVFERFYRAPEARALPGSGLGLAIVKQVSERHGGSIRVESSDSSGTDMRLVLPGRANN